MCHYPNSLLIFGYCALFEVQYCLLLCNYLNIDIPVGIVLVIYFHRFRLWEFQSGSYSGFPIRNWQVALYFLSVRYVCFAATVYLSKESPTQLVWMVDISNIHFLFCILIVSITDLPVDIQSFLSYVVWFKIKLVKNNNFSCKMYWYRQNKCSHCYSRCMSDDAPLVALAAYDYIKQRLYGPSNEFIYYWCAEERKGLSYHWVCSLVLIVIVKVSITIMRWHKW